MPPPLVDICCNLAHPSFRDDLPEVLARAAAAGVSRILATGSTLEDSAEVIALAAAHPDRLAATAGLHPHHAGDWSDATAEGLRALARAPEVRALGETGLDFNRNYSTPADQERAFLGQLELAGELGLPLFLHERDAAERMLALLRPRRAALGPAVVHCFTGDAETLAAYIDLDLHIGVTGWICDERRGLHLRELVGRIPEDRLMLETDAPYLLPRDLPERPAGRRNEPAFLPHVLQAVARACDRPPEQVARATTATARAFYRLPPP
jgi:TatD DNase family protein